MPAKSRPRDKQQPVEQQTVELVPDFAYESRREFVEKLAYKLWIERGRPLGSPEVDWFAAENAVYESLVASGAITPSPDDQQNMREKIYR